MRFVRTGIAAVAAVLAFGALVAPAHAASRVKDLASIEGVRQNQLIGYGLVVGLNGTGDTLNNIPFTRQSLQAMLERLGVNVRGQTLRTGNIAAVMVTANLPAFGTQGTRIDVTVSAMGDSKSLQGGTLLVTPLLGADGNVYAVAQGSLAIGGLLGGRRCGENHARRADRRPHLQRRDHRARDRFRAEPPAQPAARTAQRRLHHRQAHRAARSTTISAGRRPSRSIPRPCSSPFRRSSPARSSRC